MNISFFERAVASYISLVTDFPSLFSCGKVKQGFEQKAENNIRIMSFNVRCGNVGKASWEDRIDLVTDTILNGHPDSVGLQEATTAWMETLKETLKDEYDYVGVGRDDGASAGEHSSIFYLKNVYSVVDSGTFWLSETPDVPSKGWDSACKRVCTWAILENKSTGERYVHLNSHLDNRGTKARLNGASLILQKAESFSDLPIVFTADMNTYKHTKAYAKMASGCLNDAKFLAKDTMDYLTFHDTKPIRHFGDVIDFCFINDKFKATAYKVITDGINGQYVSDHYPIYVDIEFKK